MEAVSRYHGRFDHTVSVDTIMEFGVDLVTWIRPIPLRILVSYNIQLVVI